MLIDERLIVVLLASERMMKGLYERIPGTSLALQGGRIPAIWEQCDVPKTRKVATLEDTNLAPIPKVKNRSLVIRCWLMTSTGGKLISGRQGFSSPVFCKSVIYCELRLNPFHSFSFHF